MGAWIETNTGFVDASVTLSHPMWVRGLKQTVFDFKLTNHLSHPMWVRGLKLHTGNQALSNILSHPMWVRGLKHTLLSAGRISQRRILCGCVD